MTQADVLYIPDVATKLGITENAVRGYIRRGTFSAIPKPFRLGPRRLAWYRADFDAWLKDKAKGGGRRRREPSRHEAPHSG